jgi:hypothetical protein
MKSNKINRMILVISLLLACKAHSQATNQWGAPVFGAQLSISVSNNVIPSGSTVLIQCSSTNSSTNDVYFVRSDSRWMYWVYITNSLGENVELTGPDKAGDSSPRRGRISIGQCYKCLVPVMFDDKVKAGTYQVIVKQDIHINGKPIHQNIQRGQIVSNPLNIEIK